MLPHARPASATPTYAILGPTASGKSALGAALAAHLGGAVLNGDPFQAYRELPIGTGQPGSEEIALAPHLGYGCLELLEELNPYSFAERVRIWGTGHPGPLVVVTGSGLYLRALWGQLQELPEVEPRLVVRTRAWMARLGPRALYRYLAAIDPQRASQVHPNDRSRITRALALHLATGTRPSELLEGVEKVVPKAWRALRVQPSRGALRERISRRVHAMVEAGWEAEALACRKRGQEAELRRLRPLGYAEWLDGGPPGELEARIVQATQAYAKRQETYFQNQWPELPTWDPDQEDLEAAFAKLGIRKA